MPAASPRQVPLALDAESFRTLGHALVDQLAGLLAAVPDGPVTRDEPASAVRAALDLDGPLPEQGTAPGPLLAETAERLFGHSLFNAHPRFFGYITASPAPIGILGDLLAAALNANVGARVLSPAATELEAQTVRWIAQLIGFPTACGGLMVSGGNMANLGARGTGGLGRPPGGERRRGVAAAARLRIRRDAHVDPVGRQRHADPRVLDARPRQPRAHAVAAVPVDRSRVDALEDPLGRIYHCLLLTPIILQLLPLTAEFRYGSRDEAGTAGRGRGRVRRGAPVARASRTPETSGADLGRPAGCVPPSIARHLATVEEATEVPQRSPGRGPPYWKSRVLRLKLLVTRMRAQGVPRARREVA